MAHYNTGTDEIKGCQKGSLVWEHENRHKEQFHLGMITKLRTYADYLLYLLVGLSLPDGWTYTLLFFIFLMLHSGYIELEAWYYAFKRYYK
jgi:hypothetical protein